MPPSPRSPWTLYRLAAGRYAVELAAERTPPGLALEAEVIAAEGRTWAVWRLSQTGAVVAVVRAGAA